MSAPAGAAASEESTDYRQYPHQPCLGPGRWAEADQLSQLLRKGKTSPLQRHALDTRFMVAVFPHVVDIRYHRQSSTLYRPPCQCPVSTPLLISGRKPRVYSRRGEGWRAVSGKYDVNTGCNVVSRLELPTNPRELSQCPENEPNQTNKHLVSKDS